MSERQCVHASPMRPSASGTQAEPNASMRPPLNRGRSTGRIPTLPAVRTDASPLTDWPPRPAWFAAWMKEDDARRMATLAAALQRKADFTSHEH
jgi:hypothetical protein